MRVDVIADHRSIAQCLAVALAVAFAGCSENVSAQGGSGTRHQGSLLDQFDTADLAVSRDELLSGGPPKDGIPALTDPSAVPVKQADFLNEDDRVVGIRAGGEARAYPIRLLNWHEIVNDVVGGVPVAVVYCPLCDSVSVVDRRMAGKTLEFGVSGLLHNSNVVLYDRTHQALWSQVGMEAISGPYVGQSLKHLPFDLVTFGDWRKQEDASRVANFETGHARNYGRNPYASYFRTNDLMFPVAQGAPQSLPPKTRVLGIRYNGHARAYPVDEVVRRPQGRLEDTLGGGTIVLEASSGETISVTKMPDDAKFTHTFWFAWSAFHPDTEVFEAR